MYASMFHFCIICCEASSSCNLVGSSAAFIPLITGWTGMDTSYLAMIGNDCSSRKEGGFSSDVPLLTDTNYSSTLSKS